MSKFSALSKILGDIGKESKTVVKGLGSLGKGAAGDIAAYGRGVRGGMGKLGEAAGEAGAGLGQGSAYTLEQLKKLLAQNKKGAAALGAGALGVGAGGAYGIDKLLEELED